MNFLPGKVTAVDGASATVQLADGSSITVPCQPGGLKPGASVTLGVRPEHLRPAEAGEISGEAMVVERLGGETFIYTQIGAGEMLVIQADGEVPTRVHDNIMVKLDPQTCHLFDSAGLAVGRAERHPLADVRRTSGRKAS